MAIVASNLYPSRIITGDTGYPYGKARDLVNGEKGTGTPLRATWVNDQWGFLQALLDAADIIPSGTPDQVGQSDYLDAIRNIVREPLQLKIFQSPTDNLTKIETFAGDVGVAYQVRKTSDNSLATIYSDKDSVNEIAQNGTSNISDDNAECVFYIAEGDYTVTINSVSTGLSVARLQILRAHEASTTNPHNVTKSQIGLGSVDNVSAANLRNRGTHTGTQTLSTISDAGSAASKNTATTAEAIAGISNKLPDTIGVHASFNQYGIGSTTTDIDVINDTTAKSGLYRTPPSGSPTGGGFWHTVFVSRIGGAQSAVIQIRDLELGSTPEMYIRHRGSTGAWTDPAKVYHSRNTNFNEFSCNNVGDIMFAAYAEAANRVRAYAGLNSYTAPTSISVVGTFTIKQGNVTIETGLTPILSGLGYGKMLSLFFNVSNTLDITKPVQIISDTSDTQITVNF